jgi:hypothetical protein
MNEILKWTLIGAVFQIAMVVTGHYWEGFRYFSGIFGMSLSLIFGALYVISSGPQPHPYIYGGVVGAACGFLGIAVAVALRDQQPMLLAFGTIGSFVAGLGGAALAPLAKNIFA